MHINIINIVIILNHSANQPLTHIIIFLKPNINYDYFIISTQLSNHIHHIHFELQTTSPIEINYYSILYLSLLTFDYLWCVFIKYLTIFDINYLFASFDILYRLFFYFDLMPVDQIIHLFLLFINQLFHFLFLLILQPVNLLVVILA